VGTNHPAVQEGLSALGEAFDPLPWPPAYPNNPIAIINSRERIASAIEMLETGLPYIAKDPLSKVVVAGANQILRVEAVGWPVPEIQWQHQGTNLPGATSSRLELTNLTAAMAGEYRAVASNVHGSATSAVGVVTVLLTNQPPIVIKYPDSLTRTNGGRAVFGAGVSSLTPLGYQWFHNGSPIAGATNVTLVLPSVDFGSAGYYLLSASNSFGVATSAPAMLNIQVPSGAIAPFITVQPTNQTGSAGQSIQFAVMATGTSPLSYQWAFNGTNVAAGGNSNVLVLTNVQPAQSGSYWVVVANVAGVVTSTVANLTVQEAIPVITSQPTNQFVLQGQNALFAVAAGGTMPLAYQWFFNQTNLVTGANGSVLQLTNVQPGHVGAYSVLVTNWIGAVTSTPALLQISGMPNYTNEPACKERTSCSRSRRTTAPAPF
jgi:hypothetical protein